MLCTYVRADIYQTGELDEQTTCRKFRHMGSTGQEYETKFYNLDAIISVGYRVNSIRLADIAV